MQRLSYLPAGAAVRRVPHRSNQVAGAAAIALLLLALTGCSSTEGLPGLSPPHTETPVVASDQFPSVGAPPAPNRAPALTPQAQQKLQSDLERLARTQQSRQARPDQN